MATQLWKDGKSQFFETKRVQTALASGWTTTDEKDKMIEEKVEKPKRRGRKPTKQE